MFGTIAARPVWSGVGRARQRCKHMAAACMFMHKVLVYGWIDRYVALSSCRPHYIARMIQRLVHSLADLNCSADILGLQEQNTLEADIKQLRKERPASFQAVEFMVAVASHVSCSDWVIMPAVSPNRELFVEILLQHTAPMLLHIADAVE